MKSTKKLDGQKNNCDRCSSLTSVESPLVSIMAIIAVGLSLTGIIIFLWSRSSVWLIPSAALIALIVIVVIVLFIASILGKRENEKLRALPDEDTGDLEETPLFTSNRPRLKDLDPQECAALENAARNAKDN